MIRAALFLVLFGGCAASPVRPTSAPACTAPEIRRFLSACVDPATALVIHCEQAQAQASACAKCLRAPDGPLIERAGRVEPNVEACVARAGAHCNDLFNVARLFCG